MLTPMNQMVLSARAAGHAVPAFTCYDFSTALSVIAAAEHAGRGVILNVAPKTANSTAGLRLISGLNLLGESASVDVAVQLDHATDAELIVRAVQAGATAVLADGSALGFDQNIAFVREIRELVGPQIVLEAELGALSGNEDQAFEQTPSGLTDPTQVSQFLERSEADLLAVAIGNVHGRYRGEPKIHWDVLEEIQAAASVPLVLHGASGIDPKDLARSIGYGVGKVNLNTELRTAVLATLDEQTQARQAEGQNLLGLLHDCDASVQRIAQATFQALTAS